MTSVNLNDDDAGGRAGDTSIMPLLTSGDARLVSQCRLHVVHLLMLSVMSLAVQSDGFGVRLSLL